jgi:predicted TIM-barrel fold metal-dependent hydrolase
MSRNAGPTQRLFAPARLVLAAALLGAPAAGSAQTADRLPIFDAHVHYSHDAWEVVPTADVIALMRKAGLQRALVSSSNDDGTQKLHAAAPDLIVPSLRPYRTRGEISTWVRDESIVTHLEQRLARYRYAAIGEFHLYGADADLPVPRRLVQLARQHGLILHAHSDADAVERLFRQDPNARILWAHSGFERPARVREMLRKYPNLWADLAFRTEHGSGGKVDPEWREAFQEFPGRFMVGTDTFTPERLHYIPEHANWSRAWLADLPRDLAERIAWRNGEALVMPVWQANRAKPLASADQAGDACAQAARAPGAQRLESTSVVLVWRAQPEAIRVGRPFSVSTSICPKQAGAGVQSLAVDATMPEHQHGMNYAPRVVRSGEHRYDAEGLLFHMPGRWQLAFDVRVNGHSERLARDLQVR